MTALMITEIENNITKFRAEIEAHYETLNTEAIWLFLATLGCWGVSVDGIKLIAMLLTFYFLYRSVADKHLKGKTHSARLKIMRKNIENADIEEGYKKKLLIQLQTVNDDLLANIKTLTLNDKFMLSAGFFAISAVYFITS